MDTVILVVSKKEIALPSRRWPYGFVPVALLSGYIYIYFRLL